MNAMLSAHISIIGLVFFVLTSLLGIARQWTREKFLSLKPRRHVLEILIYICNIYLESGLLWLHVLRI